MVVEKCPIHKGRNFSACGFRLGSVRELEDIPPGVCKVVYEGNVIPVPKFQEIKAKELLAQTSNQPLTPTLQKV